MWRRMFLLTCGHYKDTVSPAESICRTLEYEEYFFVFGSQADITDICAHCSGPSETLAPDTGAFWCCKYVTLHLVSKQTWWMQYLFSQREHLHELQPHPKSKPSSAISVSVLHSCGAPIIFLQLISGFPVWVFQERRFPMVLALPPSMGL